MRAVALSDAQVKKKIKADFIPLKVVMQPGAEVFPIDWPATGSTSFIYKLIGGKKATGYTGCVVISPDREIMLGNTGSLMVWEMFEAIGYDPVKMAKMLDDAKVYHQQYSAICNDDDLGPIKKKLAIAKFNTETQKALREAGKFSLPPKGFSVEKATKLFELTGDVPKK